MLVRDFAQFGASPIATEGSHLATNNRARRKLPLFVIRHRTKHEIAGILQWLRLNGTPYIHAFIDKRHKYRDRHDRHR
ncbi:hypothetical protein CWB41_06555 [Methylovirgula ligni]|nr:hypothetical protein CWB41_06555 [Methylovirgula ligni]